MLKKVWISKVWVIKVLLHSMLITQWSTKLNNTHSRTGRWRFCWISCFASRLGWLWCWFLGWCCLFFCAICAGCSCRCWFACCTHRNCTNFSLFSTFFYLKRQHWMLNTMKRTCTMQKWKDAFTDWSFSLLTSHFTPTRPSAKMGTRKFIREVTWRDYLVLA